MTLKDKEASTFLKRLFDMNQIVKNIYKDEPNFSPVYILSKDFVLYTDENCIPEILQYNFNEPLSEQEFSVTVNSNSFFSIFKEPKVKNSIDEIEITSEEIVFISKGHNIYSLKNNNIENIKLFDVHNNYFSNIRHYDGDDYAYIIEVPENIVKYIMDNNKELVCLILDVDNSKCYIKDDTLDLSSIDNYLEFFVNKKFINGISYKVKHLKKGDEVEYTPIILGINVGSGDNYYDIELKVFLKNKDIVEHHFMIVDF